MSATAMQQGPQTPAPGDGGPGRINRGLFVSPSGSVGCLEDISAARGEKRMAETPMHAAKARWKLGPRCDKRPTVEKGDAPRAEQRQKTYASDSHEQVRQRASHPQPFLPPTPPLHSW